MNSYESLTRILFNGNRRVRHAIRTANTEEFITGHNFRIHESHFALRLPDRAEQLQEIPLRDKFTETAVVKKLLAIDHHHPLANSQGI